MAAEHINHLGQPIGFPVDDWQSCPIPPRKVMTGRDCQVVPLNPEAHAKQLHEANLLDASHMNWTYLAYGPFHSLDDYAEWLRSACLGDDPMYFAVVANKTNSAVGLASYLNIVPDAGTIEVGHINFSPRLQKSRAATESMYLMMHRAIEELGYRRYEWKCDALNQRSRRAAERLGFRFEGVFRQATLYKGRNRDTAWYSITDKEWNSLKQAYQSWLSDDNFDSGGQQKRSLAKFMNLFRKQ